MPPPTSRPLTAPERVRLALTADLVRADKITDALIDLINAHVGVLTHPQSMHLAKRLGDYFRPITDPDHPAYLPQPKDRPCPATTPPTTSSATRPARTPSAPAATGSPSRSTGRAAGAAPKA